MTDYEKEYEQYSHTNMSRGQLIALKCLKYAARGLIFGIIALVLWRVLFSGHVPKNMETLTVNDALYDAYVERGDELTEYSEEMQQIGRREEKKQRFGGLFLILYTVVMSILALIDGAVIYSSTQMMLPAIIAIAVFVFL